jgi:hypothetical protein
MVEVRESVPLDDSVAHNAVQYKSAHTFNVTEYRDLFLYAKNGDVIAFYPKGSFDKVQIFP